MRAVLKGRWRIGSDSNVHKSRREESASQKFWMPAGCEEYSFGVRVVKKWKPKDLPEPLSGQEPMNRARTNKIHHMMPTLVSFLIPEQLWR
jgi:hypothetical protein